MTEQTDAEPIVWGKAYMRWTRYGYDFRVPLWAEERPLVECEEQLRRAIFSALDECGVTNFKATPMEVTEDNTGASAEPGELVITAARLLNGEAAESLRESVTEVVKKAIERANRLEAADEQQAQQVAAVLRHSAS